MKYQYGLLTSCAILLSACGTTTTTTTYYPYGKPDSRNVKYESSLSFQQFWGILDSANLNFEYDYKTALEKKTDGTIINKEIKVYLPNVEVVMHPKFTSDDKIAAFLSEQGAMLSSNADEASVVSAVKASMPSSKLKKVIHTVAFEKEVLASDVETIRVLYQSVFNESKSDKSLVVVPAWKDSAQSAEMIKQLYDLLFNEALNASKRNPTLNITLFASSKEQEDSMRATLEALEKKLGIKNRTMIGSASGNGASSSALTKLSAGKDAVKMSQGSATISGAATNLGDVRLMGVFAEGSARNNQSTLMVGFPVGNHMVAVGTELGFENKELTYSAAKLLAMMSATESLKFSAAISSVNEKVSMFFNQFNRSGVMVELGAHYNEHISQDVNVSINGGLRGLYSSQLELGWFGQVSLDVGSFKASTFVSSSDVGFNFGVGY